MNYWVIKGRPNRNKLKKWLRPDHRAEWRTRRPARDWRKGDRLFFWEAGPVLKMVGLGTLITTPLFHRRRKGEYRFTVRYDTHYLAQPLGLSDLRRDCVVGSASFLKPGPAGMVFPLTFEQGEHLYSLLRHLNGKLLRAWADNERSIPLDVDLLEAQALEGGERLLVHLTRERDKSLIRRKKQWAMQTNGHLACEVCKFDFGQYYGDLGKNFCEVHHIEPLSLRKRSSRTFLKDLSIVCSNCHRMLHREYSKLSIVALRQRIRRVRSA